MEKHTTPTARHRMLIRFCSLYFCRLRRAIFKLCRNICFMVLIVYCRRFFVAFRNVRVIKLYYKNRAKVVMHCLPVCKGGFGGMCDFAHFGADVRKRTLKCAKSHILHLCAVGRDGPWWKEFSVKAIIRKFPTTAKGKQLWGLFQGCPKLRARGLLEHLLSAYNVESARQAVEAFASLDIGLYQTALHVIYIHHSR